MDLSVSCGFLVTFGNYDNKWLTFSQGFFNPKRKGVKESERLYSLTKCFTAGNIPVDHILMGKKTTRYKNISLGRLIGSICRCFKNTVVLH